MPHCQLITTVLRSTSRTSSSCPLQEGTYTYIVQKVMLLCRQAQQKWDLATVCLDHMRLAVKGLAPLSSSVSVHYPGMAVMLQLLGAPLPIISMVEQAITNPDQCHWQSGRPL